jgi:hypothetical protein
MLNVRTNHAQIPTPIRTNPYTYPHKSLHLSAQILTPISTNPYTLPPLNILFSIYFLAPKHFKRYS